MHDRNFRYLEKQWFVATAAETAFNNFSKWRKLKLSRVLQHHGELGEEPSDWETLRRADFDCLLTFYGIVEIGIMTGFIEEMPPSFRKEHLPLLCDGIVRRYYEWHYPQDLPRRLRERLQSGVGYYVLPKSAELNVAFHEFLKLTKFVEHDGDLHSFLWALDRGFRTNKTVKCDFARVKRGLLNAKRLASALQLAPEERGELDRALNGFCKFIQFCEAVSGLIECLEKTPQLAEAVWLAYGYWFRQLDTNFGADLKGAIRCLTKWKVSSQDTLAFRKRIAEMQKVLRKLALPPLADWQRSQTFGRTSISISGSVSHRVEALTRVVIPKESDHRQRELIKRFRAQRQHIKRVRSRRKPTRRVRSRRRAMMTPA
ncbi:MAG TPA: hypothetical protein VNU68_21545 [Verrucomicrobiae bacterium]|nr:hypothetical protein [Verrucomicrobiae bacterium]